MHIVSFCVGGKRIHKQNILFISWVFVCPSGVGDTKRTRQRASHGKFFEDVGWYLGRMFWITIFPNRSISKTYSCLQWKLFIQEFCQDAIRRYGEWAVVICNIVWIFVLMFWFRMFCFDVQICVFNVNWKHIFIKSETIFIYSVVKRPRKLKISRYWVPPRWRYSAPSSFVK